MPGSELLNLDGEVVLVTGGSRGIGRAVEGNVSFSLLPSNLAA